MALGLPLTLWAPLVVMVVGPGLLWLGVWLWSRRRPVGVATLLASRTVLTLGLGFAGLVATATLFILNTGLGELRDRHVGDLLPVAQELAAVWQAPSPADAARPVLSLYGAAHPDARFAALTFPGCDSTCVVLGTESAQAYVSPGSTRDYLGRGDRLVALRGRIIQIVTSAVRDEEGLPRAMVHAGVDASHVVGQARDAAWLLTGMGYCLLLVAALGGRRRLAASLAERIRTVTRSLRTEGEVTPSKEGDAPVGRELVELASAVEEHVQGTLARLRAADERYRRLVEHSPDAIVLHDGARIRYVNAAAVRLTGAAGPEELKGAELDRWLRFGPGDVEAGGVDAPLREGRILRVDRPPAYVEVAEIPLEGYDDPLWQAVIRDVSDRHRAEEALKRSESLYRELVQQAPHGILRVDVEGRVEAANPAALRLLGGLPMEDVAGERLSGLAGLSGTAWRELEDGARAEGRIPDAEMEWRVGNGHELLVRVTGRALTASDGAYGGLELLVEDVTERKELEDQLRQAQKMEALGHLTGGVAHDFNNLLTVILTNVRLLDRGETPGAEPPEELAEIAGAARQGAGLVRKLLAFSRPDKLERRPASVTAVLREVTSMLRRVLPESIDLSVRLPDSDITVLGDAGALSQILVNLATNARDAMPGGGEIRIIGEPGEVSAARCEQQGWGRPGPHVRLAVQDSGSGMTPEVQAKLFEPFFTTKELGSGTGLGMSIVYSLVRHHEGHIEVTSRPEWGTEIEVLLPVAESEAISAGARRRIEPAPHRSARLLVVEDEVAIRRSTRRLLERHGHEVEEAEHGGHALRLMDSGGDFDLVVSDLMMPELGGRELYDRIRARNPVLPFLFVSGYSRDQVGQFAEDDPSVRFLNKPWELGELLRAVGELLDPGLPTLAAEDPAGNGASGTAQG